MARTSKVEACLICGEVPCNCDSKRKRRPESKARPKFVTSQRDLTLEAAVQAVAPLLCKADRQVYKNMIHPPLHNQRQIEEWREAYGNPDRVLQARSRGA